MNALTVDVEYTRRRIDDLLAAFPELGEDEDLRAGTIEGETDLPSLLSRLCRRRQEANADIAGLADYIGALSERKARLGRAAEFYTGLIRDLMQHAALPKIALPEATISVTKPRTSVMVEDAHALPQGFVTMTPIPDKGAIKAGLEAGDDIPGARLVTGEPGITIRVR
jgi:hypothetical protein